MATARADMRKPNVLMYVTKSLLSETMTSLEPDHVLLLKKDCIGYYGLKVCPHKIHMLKS